MKVVIPGGTGQVGAVLGRALAAKGHEVVILGRSGSAGVAWDARTLGPWTRELEGADVVVNLAGRSVNCRYTPDNLTEMLVSTHRLGAHRGRAIAAASRPPRLWLQMSTATIYAHATGGPNGEDGELAETNLEFPAIGASASRSPRPGSANKSWP